jgi:Ca2+-binding RTX toxin-like protein
MATLTVGTGQQYSTIASAVAASRDGDVLQVQAGTYTNDFAQINTKITLLGVGGMVKMVATGNIPNDKGILITNTDVTIDHFEFSGAKGPSGNDAGIRYQGGNLVVTNSYFHHNQNGILANPVANGTITIDNSEFAYNGAGDGYTHNLYVGNIAKLTITDSYFHDASVGNEIKSRAAETVISNTRVYDNSSDASWSIDLPNGGKATLTNNIIEQGPNSQNSNIISFGVEGSLHAGSGLTMSNNVVVNDLGRGALIVTGSGATATVTGTQLWGSTTLTGTGVSISGTTTLAARPALDTSHPYDGTTTTSPVPTVPTTPTTPTPTVPETPPVAGGKTITGTSRNDTLNGGSGADTMNGGNGNDLIQGAAGSDSINGGNGADTILGGDGKDVLIGGAGNDILSGGAGDDTLTGGLGADIFHVGGGAGADRVLDFNYAQGDRVVVDAGATGGMAIVGADIVITLDSGASMILVGVNPATLGADWAFFA